MQPRRMFALLCTMACRPVLEVGPAPVVEARSPVEIRTLPAEPGTVVVVEVTCLAGSSRDPVGSEGLAALSWLAAAEDTDVDGLQSWEPGIEAEHAWVRATCAPDDAQLCVDAVTHLLLAGPSLETVTRLRAEHREVLEAPGAHLPPWLWTSWAYQAHGLAHPPLGRAGVLDVLTAEQAQDFHRAHVVREATRVGLAGAWSEAHRASLEAALEALPTARAPEYRPFRPLSIPATTILHLIGEATEPSEVVLGHPGGVGATHPDGFALRIALQAAQARLTPGIRPGAAWPPQDEAASWSGAHWSHPPVFLSHRGRPDQLAAEVLAEALAALRELPSTEEVDAARQALVGELNGLSTAERLHLSLREPLWLESNAIAAITDEAVRAVWQRLLSEAEVKVVVRAPADALLDGVALQLPSSSEGEVPWLRIEPDQLRRVPPQGALR